MLNNEINQFVRKAYKNNLLTPLISQFRKKNNHFANQLIKKKSEQSKVDSKRQSITIDQVKQQKGSEEYTGRSSSKLSSSVLIARQERRNTQSPQKLMRILSVSQDEIPQQLADVAAEISMIEINPDIKQRSKTIQIKNIRINRLQLIKYFQRFYPDNLCEQIAKALKIPQLLGFQQYQQWINQIENLDIKQSIRICFMIYDVNNQGEITTHNLIELLKQNMNQSIEQDMLHMIKQTKVQISNQINNEIKQVSAFTLPASLLRVKLDQSVLLQQQRRQSILSNDGRGRLFSKISQRNSFELNLEPEQEQQQEKRNITPRKRMQLITQINNEINNNIEYKNDNFNGVFQKYRSDRRKKRSKTIRDENKISIDLNGFINIWYPSKPNIFYDLIRVLTAKT